MLFTFLISEKKRKVHHHHYHHRSPYLLKMTEKLLTGILNQLSVHNQLNFFSDSLILNLHNYYLQITSEFIPQYVLFPGKIGDWKNWFTVAESALFDNHIVQKLKGYNTNFIYE